MNLYLKGFLQTIQSLVIKIILLSVVFLFSCLSSKQRIKKDQNIIITKEITKESKRYKDEIIYLDFNLNNYLIKFLKDNKLNENDSENNIFEKGALSIFDIKENSLESYVHKIKIDINNFNLPVNFLLKEKDSIKNNSISIITHYYRRNLFLSTPFFLKERKIGLIAFATGIEGSMQGGINIYQKINKKLSYYKTIQGWVE